MPYTSTLSSGQTLSGVTLPTNEFLTVQHGATLVDIVASGNPASDFVEPQIRLYGIADSTIVETGGALDVLAGGQALATTLLAGGMLMNGARAGGIIVSSGGYFHNGSNASGTQIHNGGELDQWGTAYATVVSGGGWVNNIGSLVGFTVLSGGQVKEYGQTGSANLSNGVVSAGGLLIAVSSFNGPVGSAVNVEIKAGATLITSPDASITGLTIDHGAKIIVATDLVFASTNGALVTAGNNLTGTIVSPGQQEIVYAGGTVTGTVLATGTLDGLCLNAQTVDSGGLAQGTVVGAYETQTVAGTAVSTTVQSSGEQAVGGGTARNTTVLSGGLISASGGSVSASTVYAGGSLSLGQGGIATDTLLISGQMLVASSATASSTVIRGGEQIVSRGGEATVTAVSAGGVQYVNHDKSVANTTVFAGGQQQLTNSATARLTQLDSGGLQTVTDGALATSTTIAASGVQTIAANGSATASHIESGGQLVDDLGDASVNATIVDLGGTIDFPTLASIAGATADISPTDLLTLIDGSQTITLQLAGTYTNELFVPHADTKGGTFITLSAAQTIAMPAPIHQPAYHAPEPGPAPLLSLAQANAVHPDVAFATLAPHLA